MKAIMFHRYGSPDVLTIEEVEVPQPNPKEVIIKVNASSVIAGDCEMRRFDLPPWIWLPIRVYMGLFKPRIKILGQEFAGEVWDTGSSVEKYKAGDRVFGPTTMKFGAHAEFICMSEKDVIGFIPDVIDDLEAATLPVGGLNALHFIRKGNIQKCESVLINGAGGCIGTYAVQLAKLRGAMVTAVDAIDKLDLLKTLGADHVLDYKRDDFTKNGATYDVIIDVIGRTGYRNRLKSLSKYGRYVIGNPRLSGMMLGLWYKLTKSQKVINAMAPYRLEDLEYLMELMEKGSIKAVIDKTFSLDELKQAHEYVESGVKIGHIAVNISNNGK
jgi:NADPH:quinone reductase-like Zn-dependent oxidoreductase